MSFNTFLYLVNAFMFSICFGLYTTMMLHRWKRMRALHRAQYLVVDLLLMHFVYGYVEAAVFDTPVQPRHFVTLFLSSAFFAVQLWTLYDETK